MSLNKKFHHLKIELRAIQNATNNFANCIGEGRFGKVYKGELKHSEGHTTVAIKILDRKFGQGDPEFFKEIMLLSDYRHPNVAPLLGFCDEGREKILVYEYASRRSLDKYLGGDLTWVQRLNICIGAASGLAYLHNPDGSQQRVLHRDIKSSNILLDENWKAMISDFGLSKIGPANQEDTFLVYQAVCTTGYFDPNYMAMGVLTKESDVYSFGVVLFEVFCGRLISTWIGKSFSLTRLARDHYGQNKMKDIIHENIKDEINPDSMNVFTRIAYQCLDGDYEKRPLMTEVVRDLEYALQFQNPIVTSSSSSSKITAFIKESKDLFIPFQVIKKATKNFTTVLGKGGYGFVYKGELLLSGELTSVAVKRLDRKISSQGFKEFLIEIQLLSRYKHPNLVSLLGFCDEAGEMILIYEYAEHGSLDQHLPVAKTTHPLTWEQRISICLDTACGLDYLHNHIPTTNHRVIHRDIKSANILIGHDWKAMIADLGLSKIGRANENDSYLITNASGTHGYVDPAYMDSGILTKESDVYSFGVVMFEVLCGRLCFIKVDNEHRFLARLAPRYYKTGRLNEIIDPYFKTQVDSDSLKRFLEIAYPCLLNERDKRPSMGWVVQKLEEMMTSSRVL